jgi:hypothetical protein
VKDKSEVRGKETAVDAAGPMGKKEKRKKAPCRVERKEVALKKACPRWKMPIARFEAAKFDATIRAEGQETKREEKKIEVSENPAPSRDETSYYATRQPGFTVGESIDVAQ